MKSDRKKTQRGFSFLEVMIALTILLVGSVAILSLFAIGAKEAVQRKVTVRLAQVRPEVQSIVQDALDVQRTGEMPPGIKDRELSPRGYTMEVDFRPSPFGGPRVVAYVVILFRGAPVQVLPPIPLSRSTLDPR